MKMNHLKYMLIFTSAMLVACQSRTNTSRNQVGQTPATVQNEAAETTTPVRQSVMQPVAPAKIIKTESPMLSSSMPEHPSLKSVKPSKPTSHSTASEPEPAKAAMPRAKSTPVRAAGQNTGATQALSGRPAKANLGVLKRCKICHSFVARAEVGPGLGKGHGIPGVFGRKAGTFPDFSYKFTKYIKPGKDWHWDAAHLRKWMCNAHDAVKEFTGDPQARTRMPPQHVCDPARQDAVIAALKSIS